MHVLYMLTICYVATSFPFLVLHIYMRFTVWSTAFVLPFSHFIIPIWFSLYKFMKVCNVAMLFRFLFFNIIPIVMKYFPITNWFLCSALMPVRILWLSCAHNWVAYFHTNLYNLIIVRMPKRVSIPDSFIRLGFIGGLLCLFFFIFTVKLPFPSHPSWSGTSNHIFSCWTLWASGWFRRFIQRPSVASHLGRSAIWSLRIPLHWRTVHWSARGLGLYPNHPSHALALCRHCLVHNL